MPTENVGIGVDISDLERELGKIPGLTTTQLKKMSAIAGQEWKASEKAAEAATKKWAASVERAAGQQASAIKGAAAIGVTAVTASVAAWVAVTKAIGESALSVEELDEKTRRYQTLGGALSADDIEQARDTNRAYGAVGLALDEISETYGTFYAPAVEKAGLATAELLLKTRDLLEWLGSGTHAALEFAGGIVDLSDEFEAATAGARDLADEMQRNAYWLDQASGASETFKTFIEERATLEKEALEDIATGRKMREAADKAAIDGAKKRKATTTDAVQAMRTALEDAALVEMRGYQDAIAASAAAAAAKAEHLENIDRIDREIVQERFDREIAANVAAIDAIVARGAAMVEAEEKAAAAWERGVEVVNTYGAAIDGVIDNVRTLSELSADRHREELAAIREERAELRATLKEKTGHDKVAAESRIESLNAMADAEKKAIQRNFARTQALAIVAATVDAARAAIALIPAFSALGPGAPFAAAGVASLALATEVASIRAQKPKFHVGHDPSEYQATLARGEGVANNRAMSSPQFRQTLARENAGVGSSSGPIEARVYLNDRDLQRLGRRQEQLGGRRSGRRPRPGTATHYG